MTASDIAQLAANAGFSGNDLVTAVAVALAESGGNPQAYNPEAQAGTATGKGSYGLWQIYLSAHPEFSGVNLYDPSINAAVALSVYQNAGGSFAPWSTFKSGRYAAYMNTAAAAVAGSVIDPGQAQIIPPAAATESADFSSLNLTSGASSPSGLWVLLVGLGLVLLLRE